MEKSKRFRKEVRKQEKQHSTAPASGTGTRKRVRGLPSFLHNIGHFKAFRRLIFSTFRSALTTFHANKRLFNCLVKTVQKVFSLDHDSIYTMYYIT
jgi:hypothetical protein